jgi:hypothetical protein
MLFAQLRTKNRCNIPGSTVLTLTPNLVCTYMSCMSSLPDILPTSIRG